MTTYHRNRHLQLDTPALAALRRLIDYVFGDEQKHCFSCDPDDRANSIYMLAIRPLALVSGYITETKLDAEERQWLDSATPPEADGDGRGSFLVTFTLTSHYKRIFRATSPEAAIATAIELFGDAGEAPFELDFAREGGADHFQAEPFYDDVKARAELLSAATDEPTAPDAAGILVLPVRPMPDIGDHAPALARIAAHVAFAMTEVIIGVDEAQLPGGYRYHLFHGFSGFCDHAGDAGFALASALDPAIDDLPELTDAYAAAVIRAAITRSAPTDSAALRQLAEAAIATHAARS